MKSVAHEFLLHTYAWWRKGSAVEPADPGGYFRSDFLYLLHKYFEFHTGIKTKLCLQFPYKFFQYKHTYSAHAGLAPSSDVDQSAFHIQTDKTDYL